MEYFFQILIVGLATGFLYALIAIGFVVIYKATDVFNFSQGELLLAGAYSFYIFNKSMHFGFIASFLLTLTVCFCLGLIIQRIVIKPLLGEPVISVIMVTVGLSILMKSIVLVIWSPTLRTLPPFFSIKPVSISGIYLPEVYLYVLFISGLFIIALLLFFKYSKVGIGMRATADNQSVALLMGINSNVVFSLSWAISSSLAASAGIFLAYIYVVSPFLGNIGLNLFPAVVVGGLDSIIGAVLGGLLIGLIQNFTGGYLTGLFEGGLKDIAPFVVLLLVLMIRPFGLFGKKEIERV